LLLIGQVTDLAEIIYSHATENAKRFIDIAKARNGRDTA
jgi:hypothetical protein